MAWNDDPPDAALAELGRVTWASILLEDYTRSLCTWVTPTDPRKDTGGVGQCITEALKALRSWPDPAVATQATAWLTRARDALERRNATLHAVPMFNTRDASVYVLDEMPRKATPWARRELTPDYLAGLADALKSARTGWVEIVTAVNRSRPT